MCGGGWLRFGLGLGSGSEVPLSLPHRLSAPLIEHGQALIDLRKRSMRRMKRSIKAFSRSMPHRNRSITRANRS